jgi:ribose 5-phosphate isomerase B
MAADNILSIGCDHAAYAYRASVIRMVKKMGYEVIDHGTSSPDSVDYPDHIHPVADDVEGGRAKFGIIFCGSGNGAAITANKHQKIRAALCWKVELAELARQHNDANVISIPARFVSLNMARNMVKAFLNTDFEVGRHARRVAKISLG